MVTDLYQKYYISDEQVKNILKDGLIIFDTSALLSLYTYSEKTQSLIFRDMFTALSNRLWIPAQVCFEYFKNRGNVAKKAEESYEKLLSTKEKKGDGGYVSKIIKLSNDFGNKDIEAIEGLLNTLREKLSEKEKHPYLEDVEYQIITDALEKIKSDIDTFRSSVQVFQSSISSQINERISEIHAKPDTVKEAIDQSFSIGEEYSFDKLIEISREGETRYSKEIPPGYEDSEKIGFAKYGDLYIWKQILDKAKEDKKDVLFVTNDVKEDWRNKENELPRFELLKEFNSFTNKNIWICTFAQLMFLFRDMTGENKEELTEALEEVETIEKENNAIQNKEKEELLYKELLDGWLASETSAWIKHEIPIEKEWRVFGNCHAYYGGSLSDGECIIMLNTLEEVNDLPVLYAFENLYKILKHFDSRGKRYAGFQYVFVRTREKAKQVIELMKMKSGLKDAFENPRVKNALLFVENDELYFAKANYKIGTREPSDYDPRIHSDIIEDFQ